MDLSAIGAMSIDMHLSQTQQAVDVTMMKKAMDMQEASSAALIKGMQAAAPSFGHLLDVRA